MSTNGKTLTFMAAKLKGFTVLGFTYSLIKSLKNELYVSQVLFLRKLCGRAIFYFLFF